MLNNIIRIDKYHFYLFSVLLFFYYSKIIVILLMTNRKRHVLSFQRFLVPESPHLKYEILILRFTATDVLQLFHTKLKNYYTHI